MTDNMIFNMLYYLYRAFDIDHKIQEVSIYTAYRNSPTYITSIVSALNGSKVALISEEKDVIIDAAARKDTYKLQKQLNQIQKTIS